MKKVMKSQQSKKGFTLVELIVVIAIIVIIAAVVAFNYIGIYRMPLLLQSYPPVLRTDQSHQKILLPHNLRIVFLPKPFLYSSSLRSVVGKFVSHPLGEIRAF